MPDLFEQLSKESEALLRKPNRSREGHSLTTPFQQDLGSELEGRGFTVTSGYRPNDRGSRHASGAALDIRTKDKPTEVVDVLKSELEGRGYRVLDERYVKTPKQTGPHLHVSTDDPIRREMARQSESRKPQRDIFATLADESEAVLSKQPAKPQPTTPGAGGDVVIRQPVTPSVPFPARPRNAFEQVVDEYSADKQAREAQAKKGVAVRDPYAFTVSKRAPSNLQPINKPPRLSVTPRGIQSEQLTSPIAQPQPKPARQPSTPLSRTAVTAVKAAVPALNAIPDAEIENVIGQIAAGATDTVTDVPVGLAVQAANATPLANQGLPEELRKKLRTAPIEGVKSAVQPVRDIVAEQLPIDPEAEGFLNRTLPRAVGSAVPYIGAGIATRGASPLASAMLGTTGAAAQGYEDAQRSGADADLSVASGAVNSLTGLLESVGMGRWLNSVGGKQALTKRALEVLEEGGQEGLQEWASNVNAAVVSGYDPERPLSQGVLESTLAGLLIGAGAQGAGLVNANAPNAPIAPESASRPIPQAADAIPPQQNVPTQIISNESLMQARRAAEQAPPTSAPASPQTAAPSANDDFFGGLQSKLGRVKGQPAQGAKASAPSPRVEILPSEGEPDIIKGTKVTEVKVNGETYRVRVPSAMNKGEASIHVKEQLKAQQQPATVPAGTTGLSRAQAQPSPIDLSQTTVRIGDKEVTLTPEQSIRWQQEIVEPQRRKREQYASLERQIKETEKTNPGAAAVARENLNSRRKADAMTLAAKKREIAGVQTSKERGQQEKREQSNYTGKKVSVGGRNGVVVGSAFGKVRVKLDDGQTISATQEQVTPPVVQSENADNRTSAGNAGQIGAETISPRNAARTGQPSLPGSPSGTDRGTEATDTRREAGGVPRIPDAVLRQEGVSGQSPSIPEVQATPQRPAADVRQSAEPGTLPVRGIPVQSTRTSGSPQERIQAETRGIDDELAAFDAASRERTNEQTGRGVRVTAAVQPTTQADRRDNLSPVGRGEVRSITNVRRRQDVGGGKPDNDAFDDINLDAGFEQARGGVNDTSRPQQSTRTGNSESPQANQAKEPQATKGVGMGAAAPANASRESDIYRTKGSRLNEAQLDAIDARAAKRGEKGGGGQFHRYGLRQFTSDAPLLAHPELREMLALPPVPEYGDTTESHNHYSMAAAHTADALAEKIGLPRSSQMSNAHFAQVERYLQNEGASESLLRSFSATKLAALDIHTRILEALDHPGVKPSLEAAWDAVERGEKPNTIGLNQKLVAAAKEINEKYNLPPGSRISETSIKKITTDLNKGILEGDDSSPYLRLFSARKRETATSASESNPQPEAPTTSDNRSADSAERTGTESRTESAESQRGSVREPWQMTLGEYTEDYKRNAYAYNVVEHPIVVEGKVYGDKSMPAQPDLPGGTSDTTNSYREWAKDLYPGSGANAAALNAYEYHLDSVTRAIAEGKPVPAEVLADYPDLAPKAQEPATPDSAPLTKRETPASLSDTAARARYDKAVAELRKGVNENGNPFSPSKRRSLEDDVRDMGRKLGLPQTVEGQKEAGKQESGKVQNFTQFAVEKGYPSDYDVLDHGDLGPSGQVSNRARKAAQDRQAGRAEQNRKAHAEYEAAVLRGEIVDPDGKVTREGILREQREGRTAETQKKIENLEAQIRNIENLGTMSHLPNGKLKRSYQRTVDEYNRQITELKQARDSGFTTSFLGTGAFAKFNEADIRTIARNFVTHGKDYVSWAKAMVKDLGQQVRSQLRAIWDGLKAFVKDERGTLNEQRVVELIQKGLEKTGIAEPKRGAKLSSEYVYHNTNSSALDGISKEGMDQGSFSDRPIDFGGDVWLAIKKSDLPGYQEHGYGRAKAYEPNYEYTDHSTGEAKRHTLAAEKLIITDKSGRVIKPLVSQSSISSGIKNLAKKAGFESNADYAARKRAEMEASPEFKRWFSGSKVVDENGKPLIVYHGTSADFDSFDPDRQEEGVLGYGFYFTSSAVEAATYHGGEGQNVKPVYLSIRRPFNTESDSIPADWLPPEIRAALPRREGFKYWELQGYGANSRFPALLLSHGYDGLVQKDGESTIYVAFSPTQIKSAFNRGTFDPTNPNISAMGFGAFQKFFEKKSPKLEALREKVPIPKEYNFDNLYKALVEVIGDRNLSKKTQAKINEHWDAMIDAYNADDGAALLEHQSELKTLIGSRWWVMADLLRPLNATGEISVVGRQGFIGWATHPILSGKAFKNAAWRSGDYWNWVAKFAASEDRAFAEKAGLDYGLSHEIQFGKQSLGQEENTAVSKIIKNIPLFKQMENFNKTFIDGQRTILFQWGVKQIEKKGQPTVDAKGNPSVHVKEWAKEINRITGRGNIKQGLTTDLVNASSVVGYSPRFAISRFQGLNPARIATVTRHSPTVAGMIAKDYAKLAVVTTGFGLMLRALGATINLDDPDDDDFLVAKWGNYRVPLLQGGMHAQAKYAVRMLKRFKESATGDAFAKGKGIPRAAQQTGKFLRYKESPLARVVHDQVFDRRDVKDFVTGEMVNMGHDALGRPTSFAQSLKQSGLPIFQQQLYEAYKDEGLLGMTKISPEFLGGSANLYNSSREPLSDNDKIQSRGDQIKPRFSYTGGQSDWKAKLGLRSGQENEKAFAVRADTAKQRYRMLESQLMKSRPFQAATPEDKQYLQELLQRKVAEESNTGEAWKPKGGWMPSLFEALKRHKTETKNEAKRDAKRVIPAWQ